MAAHFYILAWKIPRTEEPGKLQSMGLQRVSDDWLSMHTCNNCPAQSGDYSKVLWYCCWCLWKQPTLHNLWSSFPLSNALHSCKVSFCKTWARVSRISEFQSAVSHASLMCNRFSGIDSTFVTMASSGQRTTLSPLQWASSTNLSADLGPVCWSSPFIAQ